MLIRRTTTVIVCTDTYRSVFYIFRQPKEHIPIAKILGELSGKINNGQVCKFNINRSAVLDGAIRGFRRLSYDPNKMMSIKFSDDRGTKEEAVDLGGPRREFLRLLMESLAESDMFAGPKGNLNLALSSSGVYICMCEQCTLLAVLTEQQHVQRSLIVLSFGLCFLRSTFSD